MLERRTEGFEPSTEVCHSDNLHDNTHATWALKCELAPTLTSPSLFDFLLDSKARHMRCAPTVRLLRGEATLAFPDARAPC